MRLKRTAIIGTDPVAQFLGSQQARWLHHDALAMPVLPTYVIRICKGKLRKRLVPVMATPLIRPDFQNGYAV